VFLFLPLYTFSNAYARIGYDWNRNGICESKLGVVIVMSIPTHTGDFRVNGWREEKRKEDRSNDNRSVDRGGPKSSQNQKTTNKTHSRPLQRQQIKQQACDLKRGRSFNNMTHLWKAKFFLSHVSLSCLLNHCGFGAITQAARETKSVRAIQKRKLRSDHWFEPNLCEQRTESWTI